MIKPGIASFKALLEFLKDQPQDFQPICRWLMLGSSLAQGVIPDHAREPSLEDLLELLRLLRSERRDLIDTATLLMAASPHAEGLRVEIQLDFLVERDPDSWNHPVQILLPPRSPYSALLDACQRRIESTGEDEEHALYKVALKLERAIVLEERAKRRRRKNREETALKNLKETPEHEVARVGVN